MEIKETIEKQAVLKFQEEHADDIIEILLQKRILEEEQGEHLHFSATEEGLALYFSFIMDLYKQDNYLAMMYEDESNKALTRQGEEALKNMLSAVFKELTFPEDWIDKKHDPLVLQVLVFYNFILKFYKPLDTVKLFMKDKLYDDITYQVDWLMRRKGFSETKSFKVLARKIGCSVNDVKDDYMKRRR